MLVTDKNSEQVGWGFLLNLRRFVISAELFYFLLKIRRPLLSITHTYKILVATLF